MFNVTKKDCIKVVHCPSCDAEMKLYRETKKSKWPVKIKCVECNKVWSNINQE